MIKVFIPPVIVIFVGGLTPLDGLPQHNIPYDNGEELPPDHGFPVRIIVPGYVGIKNINSNTL